MLNPKNLPFTNSENDGEIRWKRLIGLMTVLILLFSIVIGIKDHKDREFCDAVYNAQMEMKAGFEMNKLNNVKRPMGQDPAIPGIVLLNVGDNKTQEVRASEIHNIFIVLFEKRATYGRINIVGIQKNIIVKKRGGNGFATIQETFDKDHPQQMYDAIERATDYKVDSFIVYNNDTVKQIMDKNSLLNACVMYREEYNINDVPLLNEKAEMYATKYKVSGTPKIETPGVQLLDAIQMLAYVNLYYDEWNCVWNDWRHLYFLNYFLEDLKINNYTALKEFKEILLKGDHSLSNEQCVNKGAAIKEYRTGSINRWPDSVKPFTLYGRGCLIPDDLLKCADILHKERHEEKKYSPSERMQDYQKELTNLQNPIEEQ